MAESMAESDELNWKVAGQGEPLVLIHGLFGSLENLGGIARQLAESFTVYSLDLPNHGRSLHTEQINLPGLAECVLSWLNERNLQTVSIIGHSLGGKVAMELALTHPERIRQLVVLDIAPVAYSPHHNDVLDGLLALKPEQVTSRRDADEQLQAKVPEVAVRSFLLKNLVKQTDGGFAWRINLPVIHRDYPNMIAANRDDAVFEGGVLFIKGGNSDYILPEYRDQIVARFPNATVKIVPDTGHWLHAEKPDLVARLASRFLSLN